MYITDPVFVVSGDTTTDVMLEVELGTRVVVYMGFEPTYAPEVNIAFMLATQGNR